MALKRTSDGDERPHGWTPSTSAPGPSRNSRLRRRISLVHRAIEARDARREAEHLPRDGGYPRWRWPTRTGSMRAWRGGAQAAAGGGPRTLAGLSPSSASGGRYTALPALGGTRYRQLPFAQAQGVSRHSPPTLRSATVKTEPVCVYWSTAAFGSFELVRMCGPSVPPRPPKSHLRRG